MLFNTEIIEFFGKNHNKERKFSATVKALHGKELMKKIDPNNIRRLLIRSTNWIGDAIMTTPAVRAIRKNFPNAHISMLAKPWVAPVFESSPYVDEVVIFDGNGRHKGLGRLRLSMDLKPYGFDAAILLQNAIEAAIITFLAGIPTRIGYNTDARAMLLTHSIPCTPEIKQVHQTKYYQGILTGVGLSSDGDGLDLFISQKDQEGADKILRENGISSETRLVGINPGATFGKAKRWFPERYAELCRKLQESYGVTIIVFGGPGEEALGDHIIKMVGKNCLNLSGRTTLSEAFTLIDRCQAFFTNDSGLMHVAAALDTPQIAIFGSTNHITTSPASSKSHIIRVPMHCSPCLKPDCPKDHHNCMKAVSVDMVYDMAETLIKKNCGW